MQEIFDLYRVQVLTAGDDDIFLAVYQEVEAVFILDRHITGVKPSLVIQDLFGSFRIVVVADHDAGTLDSEFSDFAAPDFLPVLIDDLALPLVSGFADGADFVNVLDTEMDAAGSERFGQAVVGVILVIGEVIQPVFDHGRRNRLRADMHQAPLVQSVILFLNASVVQSIQDVLCPRHQQPHDRAVLI